MFPIDLHVSGPNRVLMPRAHSPSLRDLQHRMATLVLDPGDGADLDLLFRVPRGVPALDRLRVYAGGYPARLHAALEDAFPAVAHVVGHGAFDALTRRYVRERPPLYYNINDAGAGFSGFLRADALTSGLPFLPDLAELEWSIVEAFNAELRPALDASRIASSAIDDWDRVILRLQPGMRVLTSAWPIREIWEARATPIEAIDIDLEGRGDHVLVYRAGFHPCCESIEPGEAFALGEIRRGRALGDVATDLAARGVGGEAVASWFARWMTLGLVVGCEVESGLPARPR